jgi:hypothetical protein
MNIIIKNNKIEHVTKEQLKEENVKEEKMNVTQVKREIEKKTEKMIDLAYKTGQLVNPFDLINKNNDVNQTQKNIDSEKILVGMLGSGAKEFNEKVGRHMTYGEMREMWG